MESRKKNNKTPTLPDALTNINDKNAKGYSRLHRAVIEGNLDEVIYLIDRGANVNARCSAPQINGRTSLHFAIDTKYDNKAVREHIAKVLIDAGADLSAKLSDCSRNLDEYALSYCRYDIAEMIEEKMRANKINQESLVQEIKELKESIKSLEMKIVSADQVKEKQTSGTMFGFSPQMK